MPPMRRSLRMLAIYLLAGAGVSIGVALVAAVAGDLSTATIVQSPSAYDGRVLWHVNVQKARWGQRHTSQRTTGLAWSDQQAAGPPDTPTQGDIQSAWASASQDGMPEWLELEYAEPIQPTAIHIYESYNPGAVVKVTLFDQAGGEIIAWDGKDPATTQPTVAIAKLPLKATVVTRRAKVYINSPAVAGWNEIDAVGLLDSSGKVHWAKRVRASSTYATVQQPITSSGLPHVPRWTGLHEPTPAFRDELVKRESRLVDGFGWPIVALSAERTNQNTFAWPTRPIWHGLVIDAGVFAIVVALAHWLLTRPLRFLREAARARRGCCIRCGYDLQFNLAAGCPECGWRRAV